MSMTRTILAVTLFGCALPALAGMPVPAMGGSGFPTNSAPPSPADWAKARPVLQAAIECRAPLKMTPAVKASLHPTGNDMGVAIYDLGQPLTVFGRIKVGRISVIEADGSYAEPGSVMVYFDPNSNITASGLAKAARLPYDKAGNRYVRQVKGGGLLEVSEARPGEVALSCSWGAGDDE
jgi:hypothetical protein